MQGKIHEVQMQKIFNRKELMRLSMTTMRYKLDVKLLIHTDNFPQCD